MANRTRAVALVLLLLMSSCVAQSPPADSVGSVYVDASGSLSLKRGVIDPSAAAYGALRNGTVGGELALPVCHLHWNVAHTCTMTSIRSHSCLHTHCSPLIAVHVGTSSDRAIRFNGVVADHVHSLRHSRCCVLTPPVANPLACTRVKDGPHWTCLPIVRAREEMPLLRTLLRGCWRRL